jgi:hypothetical protein
MGRHGKMRSKITSQSQEISGKIDYFERRMEAKLSSALSAH